MDSHEVRKQWAERSGEYSPAYYAYYGPDETSEAVRAVVGRFLDRDARVLELGCSSGRHLAHLHEHGFDDLAGIEVNAAAFDVMRENYPDLAAAGTFYCDAIEDVVRDFEDDRFDAVYSVETLQHVHPDADWVFDELARVTGDLLVTVENEGDAADAAGDADADGADSPGGDDAGVDRPAVNYVNDEFPLYYRDWHRVFTDLGFEQVLVERGDRDTLRAFRPRERVDD